MRNFIKATATKTIDSVNDRVRGIVTGNDKLRALELFRHFALRHAYRLPVGYWDAFMPSNNSARVAATCWLERMSSACAGALLCRQPVCCVPCSSVAAG